MKYLDNKTETHLLLGLAVLISIIHVWHPVTLSPTDSGDRTNFMFVIFFLAWFAKIGYSFGRIAIGVSFVFAASTNLLIGLAYGLSMSSGNFLGIFLSALILGIVGLTFLIRKEIRIFEDERTATELSNQQI